jgi:hypothetical protein
MIFLSELEEISKEVTWAYNVGSWYFFGSEIVLNRATCHFEVSQVFIRVAYRHIISRFTVGYCTYLCVCLYETFHFCFRTRFRIAPRCSETQHPHQTPKTKICKFNLRLFEIALECYICSKAPTCSRETPQCDTSAH